jgi:hypothetical protein
VGFFGQEKFVVFADVNEKRDFDGCCGLKIGFYE